MTERILTISIATGQNESAGQFFILAHDEHGSLVAMTTAYADQGRLCFTGDAPPVEAGPHLRRVIAKLERIPFPISPAQPLPRSRTMADALGEEVCICGDYRRDHKNGTGPCIHNKPMDLTHGYRDCMKFTPLPTENAEGNAGK